MDTISLKISFWFFIFAYFFLILTKYSSCLNHDRFNNSFSMFGGYATGIATWYGDPTGAGSEKGACGFGKSVSQPPFNSMVSAGSSKDLYKGGKGCGACYEVVCSQHPACSNKPITITITDKCNGVCNNDNEIHFNLSGTAFGALALHDQANTLRDVRSLKIGYRRVACNYPGTNVAFHIQESSNETYLALVPEFLDGDDDLASVEVLPAKSKRWLPMQHCRGSAAWKVVLGNGGKASLSVRLTSIAAGETLVAIDVIPVSWAPGQTYLSTVNFRHG